MYHRGARKREIHPRRDRALCALRHLRRPEALRRPDSANPAGGALVTIPALADASNRYTIKRALKQNPVLLTSDGRQMRTIHMSLAESARALEANADRIRTARRTIDDLTEQIEELGDVRAGLSALAPSDRESAEDFVQLSRQQQLDQREIAKLDSADRDLKA